MTRAPKRIEQLAATAALFFCIAFSGCFGDTSKERASAISTRDSGTVVANATLAPLRASVSSTAPVTIAPDSTASGASLEVRSGLAFLHLPAAVFKVLSDSLPGFAPFPISAYDSAVWASEIERDSTVLLPSVVLGDFDGDGRGDAAIAGISRDTIAEVIVLSNPNMKVGSSLLFMSPRRSAAGSKKSDELLRTLRASEMEIRRDAVEVDYIGKGSVVFYWDNGILKENQIGD